MMIRALFALIAASIAAAMVFAGGWLSEAMMPGLIHIHFGAHMGWMIAVMSGVMGGLIPIFIVQREKREPEPRMTPKFRNGQIG